MAQLGHPPFWTPPTWLPSSTLNTIAPVATTFVLPKSLALMSERESRGSSLARSGWWERVCQGRWQAVSVDSSGATTGAAVCL